MHTCFLLKHYIFYVKKESSGFHKIKREEIEMKKLLFTAAALLLVLMTACTAMAVDAGTYTWNGHSIEVVEAATGGMFAPAGMTADELP